MNGGYDEPAPPQSSSPPSSSFDGVLTNSTTISTDMEESSSVSGSSIITRHRANLDRINTDILDNASTIRRWSVPCNTAATARHIKQRAAAIPEEGELQDDELDDDDSDRSTGGERWAENLKSSLCGGGLKSKSPKKWLCAFLPMSSWLSTYKWRSYLPTDTLAGLTVGVMIIPQSMSYAKLAGLPVQFGLYSSLVPIYAYALFGSSRQLAIGPVAMVSLLLSTGLTAMLEGEGITPQSVGSKEEYQMLYATLALQTSFLVGICYIAMGLLRLGFVTIFLSHCVVSGFTSAAAIIIGLSQVKYIFGYSVPNDKTLHGILKNIFANIEQFNWKTFLLGTSCVATLLGLKKLAARYPRFKWTRAGGPLLVTVICIVLQATIDLESRGIPIVGYIPPGLPSFTGNAIFPLSGNMAMVVLSIVIVGFMESIAIAKKLAQVHGYELDASLELVGLGMANLSSGLFGGYPVTGSFSRSAVNNASGAHSGLSAMVTATMVAITLLCLTSVFELLALATLASIVISGVVSLVDYSEAIYLWRVHKFDFSVWMVAFIGTLFLGVELGLGISVGISLLLVIFESAYPHTAVLGRLPGTHHYRNIKQYPGAEMYDGIVLVRVDAPIYFANTQHVLDKINKYYRRAEEKLQEDHKADNGRENEALHNEIQSVQFVIIELSPVSHIDTSAVHMLQEINSTFRMEKNIQLCLSNPNHKVMQRLVQSGLADEIGRDHIFVSLHDAVRYCLNCMDSAEMKRIESRQSLQALALSKDNLPVKDDLWTDNPNPPMSGVVVLPANGKSEIPTGDLELGLNI